MSFRLPLSWMWTESSVLSCRELLLPSGRVFIAEMDVPTTYGPTELRDELYRRYPNGFIVRGADDSFLKLLNIPERHALSLSSSALLQLQQFKPDKKLRNLARRGEKELGLSPLELNSDGISKLQSLQTQIRGVESPNIQYFFRTDPSTCQRAFGALRKGDTALVGALVLTRYAEGAWHTELILREPEAPPGTMESLVLAATEQLLAENATVLNLGEVPLCYPESINHIFQSSTTPIAQRFITRYGMRLASLSANNYNVEGLFRFKDKFSPTWEPRYYLAAPKLRMRDLWAVMKASGAMQIVRDTVLRRGTIMTVSRFQPR